MKKGFTMIELIFVIVILGILASVAIPRLAGTKADAEISAAVANLRTLVSDAGAYHVVKGDFTNAKWNDITNVPLKNSTTNTAGNAVGDASLKVGDDSECIKVKLVEKNGNTPAHIQFTKKVSPTGTCKQVLAADPLKPYFNSTVAGVTGLTAGTSGAMAIGSSTSIYTAAATAVAAVAATTQATPKPVATKPVATKPAKPNNGNGKGKSRPKKK